MRKQQTASRALRLTRVSATLKLISGDSLPVGAVRRFGTNELPIPVTNDRFERIGDGNGFTLFQGNGWLAAYSNRQRIAVLRQRCSCAVLAQSGVAFLGLALEGAIVFVRWKLASGELTQLGPMPKDISWLGSNDDATRVVMVSRSCEWIGLYDGDGAKRWEQSLQWDEDWPAPIDSVVIEPDDSITLFCHRPNDDDANESFDRLRLAPGVPFARDHADTRPGWFPGWRPRSGLWAPIALRDVAISRDGSRVASAREVWTRDGKSLARPELQDTSASSSWGGEYQVYDLAFDDQHELVRVSGRNANRVLERCLAGKSEWLDRSTLLLPWTDRRITEHEGTVKLGDRVLVTGPRNPRMCCAFDGSVIAINSGTELQIFDSAGEAVRTLEVPPNSLATISPSGTAAVCWQGGGLCVVFASGAPSLLLRGAQLVPAFSPNASRVAWALDWRLAVTELASGHTRYSEELASPVAGLMFGGDGNLFTIHGDGRVTEWAELMTG